MEPGNVAMACIIRSRSVHCAIMRISSSMASTLAVPARKIAWESARITLFMFHAPSVWNQWDQTEPAACLPGLISTIET